MIRAEYKNTATIEFNTKQYDSVTGSAEDVEPDNYSCYLEKADETLEQLTELTDITVVDASTYWVNIPLTTDTYDGLALGDRYFISFYWTKNSIEKCEREELLVVANV